MPDFGTAVNDAGAADIGRRINLGILCNPYALFRMVKFLFRECRTQSENVFFDSLQAFPWILIFCKIRSGNAFVQIIELSDFCHKFTSDMLQIVFHVFACLLIIVFRGNPLNSQKIQKLFPYYSAIPLYIIPLNLYIIPITE